MIYLNITMTYNNSSNSNNNIFVGRVGGLFSADALLLVEEFGDNESSYISSTFYNESVLLPYKLKLYDLLVEIC